MFSVRISATLERKLTLLISLLGGTPTQTSALRNAKASHIERLKRLLEEFQAEEDEGALAAAFEGLVAAAVHRFLQYTYA
jgi:hypothetical protein